MTKHAIPIRGHLTFQEFGRHCKYALIGGKCGKPLMSEPVRVHACAAHRCFVLSTTEHEPRAERESA